MTTSSRANRPLAANHLFLLVLLSLLFLLPARTFAEFTVVDNAANPLTIYTTGGPTGPNKVAAADLAAYLTKISGAKFTVAATPSPLPDRGIFVGPTENKTNDADIPNPADLAPDAFRIRVSTNRAFLLGGSTQGTQYAVFAFLEKLGCRWWSADEETIPSLKTINYPSGDTTTRPVFSMHSLFNREAQQNLNRFSSKSRSTSTEDFLGGHNLYPLLTPAANAHTDYYPMNKAGQRAGNNLHFCYLAPGIAETLAAALEQKIKERGGELKNTIYFAGMGDWYGGMCECPACKAVYDKETWTDPDGKKKPGYTATLLTMINKTAELLEQKHPGIRLGTFAYMSLEAPPATVVPRANVIIRVPRLRHCTVHDAATCEQNRSYLLNLKRWCELAPNRVYVWEYGANFAGFLRPFPCLYSMANNLKLYAQIGIKGLEIQGNYTSTGGDLAVLKNYVWAKVMADPTLDPRAVLVDFCKGYYGPAADDMLAYVDALEKSVLEPKPLHANEFAAPAYLTPEVTAKLAACRDKALAAVQNNEPFFRRVNEATISLTVGRIWHAGPLEEQGDKLIRKDLGRYTYPEALNAVKYLRGSGTTEWAGGRAQQLAFLVMHGGPLATLSAGRVTAKIAPVMNGHIRQINFDDKPLFAAEITTLNGKGKPVKGPGGSNEFLNTRAMEMVGEPTPTKVAMRGDGGVSLFSGNVEETINKTVEMTPDGAILTRSTYRTARGVNEPKATSIRTAYLTGKDPAKVRVEYLTPENRWRNVDFSPEKPVAGFPRTAALRITLPEQGVVVIDRILTPALAGSTTATGGTVGTGEAAAPVEKGSIAEAPIPLDPDTESPATATTAPRNGGSVSLDIKNNTLITTLQSPSTPGGGKTDEVCLERKIEVTAIKPQ